ncbi:hypothetical protein [Rhodococcus opacus]|uniref:hypothetical protein n=1 Tax=Rhodococcus opacus TaxID=37919 RepID=UPI001F54017C|nr:hypothetical protein [Rhodococcus opacus]
MVLVFDAIRKWVCSSGGVCTPSSVVPTTAPKFPCGVRSCTTEPGTSSSSAAAFTAAWNAAGSMGFSADPAGAAAVVEAGNAPFDVCEVVGSDAVEQAAITTATPTASTAARVVGSVR